MPFAGRDALIQFPHSATRRLFDEWIWNQLDAGEYPIEWFRFRQ